ncbi:hypothetical protein AAG906_015506 [Vitis piasezkii]
MAPSCNNIEFDTLGTKRPSGGEFFGDKVFLALSDLNGDKALVRMGFPCILAIHWDFVKDEALGFFKEQILDAALVANEVIDSVLKRKESGVLCKLDLEKAYDRINWDFLLSVMQRMDGAYPLPRFRFWSMVLLPVFSGVPGGCRIGGREGVGIQVTHLLFADDTLVFCDDSQEQLAYLSWLLMWFEATSGLRINLNKSEILPVGLGCKVGSPFHLFGAPLGASQKSVKVWDGVEERMRKKLALWKRQFISKEEDSLSSGVLWRACQLTLSLLCKWSWRYAVERDSYWKLIISTKYGVERGGWSTCGAREGHGVGLWKEISKEGLLLLNNVSFSVGDGKRVRFWKDIWCGNTPLCEAFPSLFDLAGSKDAWVADYWDPVGEVGGWTPLFLRPFNDWEVEEAERLLSSIHGKRLDADGKDRMLWRGTKNEIFTVKSLYKSLDHSCAVSFPGNIIWSPFVPSKLPFSNISLCFCLSKKVAAKAFEEINKRLTEAPVLQLLEVACNASNIGIGGAMSQEGHSIAFPMKN